MPNSTEFLSLKTYR